MWNTRVIENLLKLKAKASDSYIVRLTGKLTSLALQSSEVAVDWQKPMVKYICAKNCLNR